MFDQWGTLLAYGLGALLAVILLVLAIRVRRQIFPKSLRNRLTLAFLGVAGISVLVVVSFVLFQIDTTLTVRTGSEYVNLATTQSERLAEQLVFHIGRVQNLNKSAGVVSLSSMQTNTLTDMTPDQRAAYIQKRKAEWENPQSVLHGTLFWNGAGLEMSNLMKSFPIFSQLILTDAYGNLVALAGEEPLMYNYGDELWWREVQTMGADDVYIGNPQILADGQTATLDIALPVTLRSGTGDSSAVIGILWAQLRLNDLTVFTDVKKDVVYELALVDNDTGLLLYNSNANKIGAVIPPEEVQTYINSQTFDFIDTDATGRNIIRGYAKLEPSPEQTYLNPLNWVIVIQSYEPDLLVRLGDFLPPVLIGGLIALLVAGVVAFWLSWQLAHPINALTDAAVTMAGGQLGHRAPESGPTELQTLARSFNSMTSQLQQMLVGLEQQVEARTERLEIMATLGERLSSILKLEDLLTEVVNQLHDRFGYYHAHIYLLDKEEQNLLVAAGTGSAGVQMKAQGHSIPVNAVHSLVARAMRTGEIVQVDNVRQTPDWLPNPLLPDTYSEMAVPITFKGKVVGVLDVQQNQIAGLDNSDAALLRSLANQVAIATNNARLFAEVETALAEAREIQRRFIEQAWDKDVVSRRSSGRVQFSLGESTTLNETVLAKARQQALTQTGPSLITVTDNAETVRQDQPGPDEAAAPAVDSGNQHHVLVAPIVLGETVIGNFQLHEVDPHTHWSEGELALITAVIDQVAQTAENLRLLNETQERASREQLIGRVSDKLRRAPDMETLMKVATSEIARVLDPARTYIRFDTKAGDGSDKTGETPANGNGKSDVEMPQSEKDTSAVAEYFEE